MDKTALIDAILEKEWPMFHNVNGDERTDCQNDYPVFQIMRRAQYKAWSDDALEAYLADVTAAAAEGFAQALYADENHTQMVFPGAVYRSQPTEYGTR